MRRHLLILMLSLATLLCAASAAQAVVVNVGGQRYGAALVPGTSVGALGPAGIPVVTPAGPCSDPFLASDFSLPSSGLCFQSGGGVLHANETFALTWDPIRSDWSMTRDYLEGFLKEVALGSHSLSSPYAVTPQYRDGAAAGDRAGNNSLYGGGCIDLGVKGESTCRFSNAIGTAAGNDYPSSAVCGLAHCLAPGDIQNEVASMVTRMGLGGRTQPGYSPVLGVMLPPTVGVCIDDAGHLCSANTSSAVQFCSYHSFVTVDGQRYAYFVQPWTTYTGCDPINLPTLPDPPTAEAVSIDAGKRLVSPMSGGQIASIVNPWLNSWSALDGSEINDRCPRADLRVDTDHVGSTTYVLQREFNNGGAIASDPLSPACAPWVNLSPTFVPPSPINAGDIVTFDGSVSTSTLLVPQAGYSWNFGDGTTGTGASLVHTFAKGGTYTVRLTVTDRGGYTASFSTAVAVNGPTGTPPPPPGGGGKKHHHTGMTARLQLVPQGLHAVLRRGIVARVTANEAADGIATLTISRKAAARAHIKHGRGATVVIGRGTLRGIKRGTVRMNVHLSKSVIAKLRHVGHVAMTLRLNLYAAGGDHVTVTAAGRY